jgi:hypothetical protein
LVEDGQMLVFIRYLFDEPLEENVSTTDEIIQTVASPAIRQAAASTR